MNTLIPLTLATLLASASQAATLHPQDTKSTLGRVGSSADVQLAQSIAELGALRATIASEKLPLAERLTGLEDQVVDLRKESDRMQRLVDAGALEIGTLKLSIKAREDELTYISSLLDEYVRNFETKIGIGEVQHFAAPIEAAKQALENKTLSASERFAVQTGFVGRTVDRLNEVIGGSRFEGDGVDMLGVVRAGQFAAIGPISLFSGTAGTAGIAVPQVGSMNPLVRPLDDGLNGGIATLLATGSGSLPLDPSRGGALKALIQKANIIHIFIKGGPIMWPMLAVSVAALAVVLERLIFLFNEQRRRDPKRILSFFGLVARGEIDEAIALARTSRDAIASTMGFALENREASLGHALTLAEARTIRRYRRGIAVLDTVITLAPLLGLLGTVTGMMGSFAVIGGDLSSPGAITGGIAEALIATAFGLVIAIVCLVPFNYLNNRIEVVESELLAAGEQLKLLLGTAGAPASGPASAQPSVVGA
jgi:biopolymer transport protein ExbB